MDAGSLAVIAGAGGAAVGGLASYLSARRTSRGRIGTSEADVLWAQAQEMRAELVTQRDNAERQRDRLIESQATQTLPALASIDHALEQITASLARIEGTSAGGSAGDRG